MVITNTSLALDSVSRKNVSVTLTESGARRFGGVTVITETANEKVLSELTGEAAVYERGEGGPDAGARAENPRFGKAAHALARSLGVPVTGLSKTLRDINRDFKFMLLEALFWSLGVTYRKAAPAAFGFAPAFFGGGFAAPAATAGAVYESVTETAIEQSMSFSAKGAVQTADGLTVDIDVELSVSASFYERHSERFELNMSFCDPLVVNFAAPAAALSQTKFAFDLDCSGSERQISRLLAGSGYLAVDWNEDGEINNGGELFGPRSGNGFADLALHDGDGNGWIDSADPVFDKLRVWAWDEQGKQSLFALGELGIGAVFLGYAAGDYALGDLRNPDGVIRSTGLYLREDGTGGTVQHVDLRL
ncbi:MAG: hypothetical protein LBI44_01370 [Oscillospiraceae bacterium]|nr:hypothetical protein [Oscillospiraceae bacterium]